MTKNPEKNDRETGKEITKNFKANYRESGKKMTENPQRKIT